MQTHSKAIAFIIIREYKPTYTRQSRWFNLVLASDFAACTSVIAVISIPMLLAANVAFNWYKFLKSVERMSDTTKQTHIRIYNTSWDHNDNYE